ncbi:hypothetical protein Tco_0841247 [Tanacetum coccineum]|uniref:CCHC-type domain-containing protein n=1 Tax=Tanacetum coccineum TaxID=301880 RepID=A0ABQ5AVV3_9ASTR
MTSLDHCLNPIFSIKECSSCGALYTADFCYSKGSLEDKILVPKPPQNCATCGNPVDGLNCRSCAFVQKCLNEGWYTIHDKNDILNTSKSSNDNINVVSAPQDPFIFNQDPGENSSQSAPQINHNCCFECGDSLDDIFCQRCTCKSCGNGAHIGYNCPPKAPIISQTIDELPQTLSSVHPTCNSGDENSFTYDSKPNFVNESPNVFNPPPQPSMYSCEFCGNDARYGHYYTPQVPFIYPDKRKEEERRIAEDQAAKDRYWKIPICYDDDEDYTTAITPVSSTMGGHISLPGIETFERIIRKDRRAVTSTHAHNSFPEYDYVCFVKVRLRSGGLTSVSLFQLIQLKPFFWVLPEFESYHFDPSFPRPPPEPPDVEICLHFKPDAPVINNFDELNEDEYYDPR